MSNDLITRIENKRIKVGVVGLGYVGLPLAVEKARAGFDTTGFDIQPKKVEMVNQGHNYIGDVIDDDLAELVRDGKLRATSDFSFVKDMDFIAICVPTPLDMYQQPDLSYVKSSAESIAKYLTPETMIVLESTTYPGTTEELLMPILEKGSGLICGKEFYLGFSPERVDPGNRIYNTKNTPKVVGAIGEEALELIACMYRAVLDGDVHTVSSPAVAEMEKILENTFRNVNIGLVNEMAILCNKMNIDIWEVIDAATTKPYGFMPFYPGPGLGGHCIPLDPYYLTWKAREYNFHTSMIEASMMINDRMPEYCKERAMHILNRAKKAINGAKVLILGVAYKQDIDDYRESPAIRVIKQLLSVGADVSYYDPWVPRFKAGNLEMESVPVLTEKVLTESDLVIVTTSHSNVDYHFVQCHANMIFDTKNAMKNVTDRDNIEVL